MADTLISAEGVTKKFGDFTAVNDISFEVKDYVKEEPKIATTPSEPAPQ